MSTAGPARAARCLTILFLSRRGTARAVMAAAIAGRVGGGRLRALAAGVEAAEAVEPATLALLRRFDYDVDSIEPPRRLGELLRGPDAPALDFVFTLSDTAAGEAPPEWPGRPITAHWSCVDPVRAAGSAVSSASRGLAYLDAYAVLERRLRIFASLPLETLSRMALQAEVTAIAAHA